MPWLAVATRSLSLALLWAACTPQPARQPTISGRAGPIAPVASPAPDVRWTPDSLVAIDGLPAITRDGNLVVLDQQDSDGGRGNANLTLIARDRRDVSVKRLVVLTVQDTDALATKPEVIKSRFAAANRWLADLHAAQRLSPLVELQTVTDDDGVRKRVEGDGVVIVWTASKLRIEVEGRVVVKRSTPASWIVADHPMYAGSTEICQNPAFLSAASVDRVRKVAVITISYEGTDTCWEPSGQTHVVSW